MALPTIPAAFTVGDKTGVVNKLNQIITALNYLFGSAPITRSGGANVNTDANGLITVTFDTPFPTACRTVVVSFVGDSTTPSFVRCVSFTASGAVFSIRDTTGAGRISTGPFPIGYVATGN